MTKLPEMTPKNYEAVYDYYGPANINHPINTLLHVVGKSIFRPEVLISDETLDVLHTQLALGKGALVASNHPSAFDAVTLPGAMRTVGLPKLQETGAMVKDSLCTGPLGIVSRATGSIPLFRPESHKDTEDRGILSRAAKAGLGRATGRLESGLSVVFMTEGTRSAVSDREHVPFKKIKDGIVTVAQDASDSSSFILPVGIHYRTNEDDKIKPLKSVIAFGEPIVTYAEKKQEIKRQIHEGMNEALGRAVSHLQTLQQR